MEYLDGDSATYPGDGAPLNIDSASGLDLSRTGTWCTHAPPQPPSAPVQVTVQALPPPPPVTTLPMTTPSPTTSSGSGSSGSSASPVLPIVGAVCGTILFLVLVVLVVFYLHRRRKKAAPQPIAGQVLEGVEVTKSPVGQDSAYSSNVGGTPNASARISTTM
eukprot:5328238-Pleurochrysis_carterae.AAC.2